MTTHVTTTIKDATDGLAGSAVIIRRMRDFVAPNGKKGSWLKQLDDKQLSEVYHRLRLRQTPFSIAKIAQESWGVEVGSETRSLQRAIMKFRDAMLGELESVTDGLPKKDAQDKRRRVKDKANRVIKKLDGLGRLRWLIDAQTDRVEMWVGKEEKTNLPLKATEEAVRTLAGLLRDYNELQIKMGILDIREPQIGVHIRHVFQKTFDGQTVDELAMVDATSKFIKSLNNDTDLIEMREDGDCTYVQNPE